jgi:hypothetical protein
MSPGGARGATPVRCHPREDLTPVVVSFLAAQSAAVPTRIPILTIYSG